MGQKYDALTEKHIQFISEQKIFFVATATEDSRVSVSPKGMDSFRVINSNRVIWLNVTGSGNETSAHVQRSPRMTIMFCAFVGKPLILRLYGFAKVIHHNDNDWGDLYPLLDPLPGARQIFDVNLDLVQSSCGMSIPFFDYLGERDELRDWAIKKGKDGLKEYWTAKNQSTIDGIPTDIVKKNINHEK